MKKILLSLLATLPLYGKARPKAPRVKPWTIFVHMAARNDLYPFSKMNLKQMSEVGSNDFVNIVVQYDEPGKKGTQRLYIEHNNISVAYQDPQRLNSGDPQSVIDFITWGVPLYPAEHYALIFWDHGTSASVDPHIPRFYDTGELFLGSTTPSMFDIERVDTLNIPLFSPSSDRIEHKGICFDDLYRSYINNEGLVRLFDVLDEKVMRGKKWDIVAFDACLCADAAMIEITRDYADYLVASEDVEPGTGWNHRLVLTPFLDGTMSPQAFAAHIVNSYAYAYHFLTDEYTQSAVDLSRAGQLLDCLHQISQILVDCLRLQRGRTVRDALGISFHRKMCTCFDDPNFKDLSHAFANIAQNIRLFQFVDESQGAGLKDQLSQKLAQAQNLITGCVVANAVGKGFGQAKGISIYLPDARMHSSFAKTTFAAGNAKRRRDGNAWFQFVKAYLQP